MFIREIVSVRKASSVRGIPGPHPAPQAASRFAQQLKFIHESMNGKLIGDDCTGKAEFIGFSVHNTGTIGRGWAGALKKTFINLLFTELWDAWMSCGQGFILDFGFAISD